jgi:uncharacterized Tic20 family protein
MGSFQSPGFGAADDGPPVQAPSAAGYVPSSEEKTTGMFCHLAALAGYVGVPFGCILGPLVVWLIRRDQSPFVDDHGRESLNFQITVLIAMLCCIPFVFILIGLIPLIVIGIGSLVCVIIAAIKAAGGELHRYPMTIRFIK